MKNVKKQEQEVNRETGNNPTCYEWAGKCDYNSGQDMTFHASARNNPRGFALGGCTQANLNNMHAYEWLVAVQHNNPNN